MPFVLKGVRERLRAIKSKKIWITVNFLLSKKTREKIYYKIKSLMTKCSLKTCIVLPIFEQAISLYRDHKEKKNKCCRFKIEINSVS